jgi:hypothetical protein
MDWARMLAYVTGAVDQELLARNEYLTAPLRRRHKRTLTLSPTHGEDIAVGLPADIHMTIIRRERPRTCWRW